MDRHLPAGHREHPAVVAFVADRPIDDAGMVAVALEIFAHHALIDGGVAQVVGMVSPAGRSFVLDVQAQFIGVVERGRVRRGDRRPNHVEIRVLDHLHVLAIHLGRRAHGPSSGCASKPGNAAELHRLAVERQHAAFDLDLAETERLLDRVLFALGVGRSRPPVYRAAAARRSTIAAT